MGIISDVLTRYRADVSDHVSKLKQLKGEERKRAQETIDANEKVKASLEDQLKTLGKIAVGVGMAYAAGKVAVESYRFALEASRLETGAAGVSIEGLRKASAGLKSDMDLLRDAIKFKSAAEKMSQKDMEAVEGAMRSLIGKGKDAQKVNEALTQALTKLSTEGLQELGIHVQKAGLSMDDAADRSELFKRVMKELRVESMGVADAELTKEERMAASGVAFENAVDLMKKSLGELVVSLAPLVSKVAEIISHLAKLPGWTKQAGTASGWVGKKLGGFTANMMGYDTPWLDEATMDSEDFIAGLQGTAKRMARAAELARGGQGVRAEKLAAGMGEGDFTAADIAQILLAGGAGSVAGLPATSGPVGAGYKGKGERDKASAAAAAAIAKEQAARLALWIEMVKVQIGETLTETGQARFDQMDSSGGQGFVRNADLLGANITKLLEAEPGKRNADAYEAFRKDKQASFLESHFGPIEDFDRYAAAFGILQSAVTGAMDAWITGSESMGTAVKKAIGAGLKALAADLAIQALKHGAYAIGSLAFGDVRGASLHGVAAAQFAAGSVAAAVAARAMGHGGADYGKQGGRAGGAGAAAPVRTGGSTPAAASSSIVYVVGDPFDTETNPRRRRQNAERLVRQVGRSSMGGSY